MVHRFNHQRVVRGPVVAFAGNQPDADRIAAHLPRSLTRIEQAVGEPAGLIDATDLPLAAVDGVVRAILVDPGAKPGRGAW